MNVKKVVELCHTLDIVDAASPKNIRAITIIKLSSMLRFVPSTMRNRTFSRTAITGQNPNTALLLLWLRMPTRNSRQNEAYHPFRYRSRQLLL